MNMPGYVVAEKDEKTRQILFHSLTTCASRTLGICELMRFMYDTICQIEDKEIRDDLTEKLVDAFYMAKKMNSRLAHYKRGGSTPGSGGKGLIKLESTKEREIMRNVRNAR